MKEGVRPPREGLARLISPGPELREGPSGSPTLAGHFAVFNQWAEIDSMFEGRFMESIAPGAFTKTISENRDELRILLNHGHDALGNQPIAALTQLREDKTGAYYEADLLDGVPPLVVSGLRARQYGASFRFDVVRDDFDARPKASAHNADALPERVIREARVFEFGPVTFPAYPGATAGIRSMTDEFLFERLMHAPKFAQRAALDPMLTAQLLQLDAFIDQADEVVDTILDTYGIADPDEVNEPEETAARLKGITRKLALIKTKALSTPGAAKAPQAGAPLVQPRFRDREEFLTWLQSN